MCTYKRIIFARCNHSFLLQRVGPPCDLWVFSHAPYRFFPAATKPGNSNGNIKFTSSTKSTSSALSTSAAYPSLTTTNITTCAAGSSSSSSKSSSPSDSSPAPSFSDRYPYRCTAATSHARHTLRIDDRLCPRCVQRAERLECTARELRKRLQACEEVLGRWLVLRGGISGGGGGGMRGR